MRPEERNKILLFFGAGVVFLIFLVWLILGPGSRVPVEIFAAPSDAIVTMDGKPIDSTKIAIKKGKHTFTATRQFFTNTKKEIDTASLGASKTIYLALYPSGKEGQEYLAKHPKEQLRYERISGAEFSALQEKLIDKYPITTELPYQTLDFKIDYDVTKQQDVVFLVTFYPPSGLVVGTKEYKDYLLQLKAEALSYFQSKHMDVKNLNITYSPDPEKT